MTADSDVRPADGSGAGGLTTSPPSTGRAAQPHDVPAERLIPRVADGVELIGPYQGSGFIETRYIVARSDGQVVQLPELLFRLCELIDGDRDLCTLAGDLGDVVELETTAEQVAVLVDKLRVAGLADPDPAPGNGADRDRHDSGDRSRSPGVAGGSARAVAPLRPDPLLMLRYRVGLIPPRVVAVIATVFRPMFFPPVVLGVLGGFIALDAIIVARGGAAAVVPAAQHLFTQPGLTLLVLVLVFAAAGFHECGHVSACRYSGASPGVMGVGLYVVWPALYSTVTDAYRLDRRGRLRTDLGGVYFNTVCMAAMAGAYLLTGSDWVLIALVLMHVETAWQFLPSVRLDGYYILADLVGIPDLFSRLGPVLSGVIPGRPTHPRVSELKPWTRRIITLWVALVVPCLLYWVIGFLVLAPRVLPIAASAVTDLARATGDAFRAGQTTVGALGVVQLFLLVLPYLGAALILGHLGRRLAHWLLGLVRTRRELRRHGDPRRGTGRHRLDRSSRRTPAHHPWPRSSSRRSARHSRRAGGVLVGDLHSGGAARKPSGASLTAATTR